MTAIDEAIQSILAEFKKAESKFPEFRSEHEGYGVLLEEVDELWYEIKNNKRPGAEERMKEEAAQVAAMALKFIVMLDNKNKTTDHTSANSRIIDIVEKYGLAIDGAKIKLENKIDKLDFIELCNELKNHGYEYITGKGVFVPKWQGVRP
jgi:NTP pyrophosphatase (non-canonical NTP hydrolase)